MTSNALDHGSWIERLAGALSALAAAQEPYLQAYRQHHPREQVIVDGRDETPYPLDDLRMVYSNARHSGRLIGTARYAPLRGLLDPTRHALLSHPRLERVAVIGRPVGENDFWMRILSSGMSISAGDLIAGLMARAAELPGNGFRAAAGELNAFLSPVGDGEAAGVLGNLDEGCDALLFWGLNVTERIDLEDNMAILPYAEVRRFVACQAVEELAPSGAGFHVWRSVGAVVRPFRWRPVFRQKGSFNEPMMAPKQPFLPEARTFLDLLAVGHAEPVVPLGTKYNCIDRSAASLLGIENHRPEMDQKWPAHGFDGFVDCPALRPEALHEVREVFCNRESTRYQRMATYVSRLAEALGRAGRFALRDRVLDVAIALEGMYELPKWYKSRTLQERVSSYLGADAEDQERIKKRIRTFYEARSDIVHSGRGEASPFSSGAAFVSGFDLARRSLFKLLHEGSPGDWRIPPVPGG
ncbi:MAG: HEPN domain-containing protein [Bryobacterales bacterium]|nr:HEPN domain-containing protein [Bryobacterales bacterium]